jgi:pimeloyl-ACP methyl ester carboxylesterase
VDGRAIHPTLSPAHRGGSGPPLVLLHGFTGSWHIWELVLERLERHYDVFAPTLAGHAGGPPLPSEFHPAMLVEAVEAALDAAGLATAHVVGNSLGGQVALQLAARGRARSVVAFAPGGGWHPGDPLLAEISAFFDRTHELVRHAGPYAASIASTRQGRRTVTEYMTVNFEHLSPELVARIVQATAGCEQAPAMMAYAASTDWALGPIECPVRIVWGTEDRLLPWPAAAARYRRALPQADWVLLDGVGHCPQLDVPLEAVELILGFT